MADEATVRNSLTIRKGNIRYQSPITAFTADVSGVLGPAPGAMTVPTTGVDINLSSFTTPGFAVLTNTGRADGGADDDGYIQVGIHDGAVFHPFMEIQVGESWPVRLARDLGEEQDVPGTGTTGTVNTLHAKAVGTGSYNLTADVFEA